MTNPDPRSGDLRSLANVGPAVAARFARIGITQIAQLRGRDAFELFEQLQEAAGHAEDPCLLDTVLSAVEQAEGGPPQPWWTYTSRRKELLARRPQPRR